MAPRLAPAHADMVSTGPSGPTCCWSGPGCPYKVLRRTAWGVDWGVDCSGWIWRLEC
eukprot:COSAG05_NODE_65_length_22456_cov_17.448540_9_plen_57_part_00